MSNKRTLIVNVAILTIIALLIRYVGVWYGTTFYLLLYIALRGVKK